jgi:predicted NUDIX family NTP pyrophosphohydrolase
MGNPIAGLRYEEDHTAVEWLRTHIGRWPNSMTPNRLRSCAMVRHDKSGIVSAGILLFRRRPAGVEFLLAHQGGPFWTNKDLGHWTIPKGEVEPGEALIDVARREFAEETGIDIEVTRDRPLGEIRQKSGKTVVAWGIEGDLDPARTRSNTFSLEWPPKSGHYQDFPEIDRVEWFDGVEARRKLKAAQVPFIERLEAALEG